VAGNPEKMSYFAFIGAPNRDKLKNALESGPTDDMAGKYPAQKWAAYQEARDVAEPLVTKRIYDMDGVNAVKEALTDLNNAIDTLDLGIKILKDYVESTDLNNGNKNALTVKLDQALNLLIKKGDKKDEAIDVMNGFVVQVNSLAGAGKLTEEETAKLIKTAEEIISNINKL